MGPSDYKVVPQSMTASTPLRVYHSPSPSKTEFTKGAGDVAGSDSVEVPLTGIHHHLHLHRTHRLKKDDERLKRRIRILRVFLRLAATSIAIGTATQEGLTLSTYLRTRNHIEDGRGPWSLQTQLWTSILLFAASLLTVILGVIMIVAYIISIRAANKVNSVQTYFAVFVELGHIALWIGVAVGYRAGKNGRDLWGWACSAKAAKIQPNFKDIVHFNTVCTRGESSWRLTIASAAIQIFGGIIWYLAYQRRKTKKQLEEHSEVGV